MNITDEEREKARLADNAATKETNKLIDTMKRNRRFRKENELVYVSSDTADNSEIIRKCYLELRGKLDDLSSNSDGYNVASEFNDIARELNKLLASSANETPSEPEPFKLRLRHPKREQKTMDSSVAGYYNFFRCGKLERECQDGWFIKHIHDNQKDHAWALFERETDEI